MCIRDRDRRYGYALKPGTTLLIVGHPGAGKTTFAATICYNNAENGIPCLYVSLGEHKQRFVEQMKTFNMDFTKLERKGLFKFVRIPHVVEGTIAEAFIGQLMTWIEELKAGVIIIDSITPILEGIERRPKARSFLQSVLYEIPWNIRGLLVLVADLPYGRQYMSLGDLEFVADIVLYLKHSVIRSLLIRMMELRKIRGAPITVAEMPFRIESMYGIRVAIPPLLEEAWLPHRLERYMFGWNILDKTVGGIYRGDSILASFPPDARSPAYLITPLALLAINNDLNIGIISYRYPGKEIEHVIRINTENIGCDPDVIMDKIVFITAINPMGYSLEELFNFELEHISRQNPDLLIFLGEELIALMHGRRIHDYISYRYNEILRLKTMGIATIRVISYISKHFYRINAAISDVVYKIFFEKEQDKLVPYVKIWRRGADPVIISGNEILKCFKRRM